MDAQSLVPQEGLWWSFAKFFSRVPGIRDMLAVVLVQAHLFGWVDLFGRIFRSCGRRFPWRFGPQGDVLLVNGLLLAEDVAHIKLVIAVIEVRLLIVVQGDLLDLLCWWLDVVTEARKS